MHPVSDGGGRRYVSGPPFKKRSVWSKWQDGHEAMLMATQYDESPDQYEVVLNYKPGYGILPSATMAEVPENAVVISTGIQDRYEPGLGVFSTNLPILNFTESSAQVPQVPRPLLLQHSVLASAPGIQDSRNRLREEMAAMEREVEEEVEVSNEDLDATEIEFDDDEIKNDEGYDRGDNQRNVKVPGDWWRNQPRRF